MAHAKKLAALKIIYRACYSLRLLRPIAELPFCDSNLGERHSGNKRKRSSPEVLPVAKRRKLEPKNSHWIFDVVEDALDNTRTKTNIEEPVIWLEQISGQGEQTMIPFDYEF